MKRLLLFLLFVASLPAAQWSADPWGYVSGLLGMGQIGLPFPGPGMNISGGSAPALLHSANVSSITSTSVTVTIPATSAGDMLVVWGAASGNSLVAPTQGANTFSTVYDGGCPYGGTGCGLFYLPSISAGITSVICPVSTYIAISCTVGEFSMGSLSSVLDRHPVNASGSTSPFSSTATGSLGASAELAIGLVAGQPNTSTIALTGSWIPVLGNFTEGVQISQSGYQVVSSNATLQYTGTISGSVTTWGALVATFK